MDGEIDAAENTGYNPLSGGKPIATFHPLRWAVITAVVVPIGLVLAALFARWTAQNQAATALFRILRYLLFAEIACVLLLACIGLLYERSARRRDAEVYRPSGKLVDVGGYRLHISCAGSGGPSVILEYGLEASYLDWRMVQPEIARFTRVCVYDRAGYGWSDSSPRPRVPSVMAEELHTLLHNSGEPSPYILVAHSFGSYNAIMFAHQFPEDVFGLVLVDGMDTPSDFPFHWRKRIDLRAMQAAIPFGIPRWRGWCGGAAPEHLRGEKQAITCRANLYNTFYRERESLSASAQEIRDIGSLGDKPLIVIARDPSLEPSGRSGWKLIQEEKLKLSTHAELVVATGSGHDVPITRPDLIIAAVRRLSRPPRPLF
jgi:pimeloyl-ACP methyl ester carboxylesterase